MTTQVRAIDGEAISTEQALDRYPYDLRYVPFTQLLVDVVDLGVEVGKRIAVTDRVGYQREQDSVTKRIAKNGFQPLLFMPLVVNDRGNGTYAIGDGGGRYNAIQRFIDRAELPYDVELPCLVCSIPPEAEPNWFVDLNLQKLGLHATNVFMARVAAGDARSRDILAVIESEGFRVVRGGGMRGGIQAIQAAESLYRDRPATLRRTLRLIRESGWIEEVRSATNGQILAGLGMVVSLANKKLTDEYVLETMAIYGPTRLLHDADATLGGGGSKLLGRGIAAQFATYLNRSTPNRPTARRGSLRYVDPEQFLNPIRRTSDARESSDNSQA